MICHGCGGWIGFTTPRPAQALVFECPTLKLRFGNERDFKEGKFLGTAEEKRNGGIHDMPKTCKQFVKRGNA